MSELVVDFVRIGNGLGNCLADGLTPLLAEAMELGAQGGVGAAQVLGDFLQGGVAGIGEDPRAEQGQRGLTDFAAGFQGVEGEAENMLGPVAVVGIDIHPRRLIAIHHRFLMGRRVGGIESFKATVSATDLGVGVAVLVA